MYRRLLGSHKLWPDPSASSPTGASSADRDWFANRAYSWPARPRWMSDTSACGVLLGDIKLVATRTVWIGDFGLGQVQVVPFPSSARISANHLSSLRRSRTLTGFAECIPCRPARRVSTGFPAIGSFDRTPRSMKLKLRDARLRL